MPERRLSDGSGAPDKRMEKETQDAADVCDWERFDGADFDVGFVSQRRGMVMHEKLHWLLHDSTGTAVLIGVALFALVMMFFGLFSKRDVQTVEADARKDAIALLDEPFQVPGGQWMKYKCTPTPCDAPMSKGSIAIGEPAGKKS